MDVDEIQKKKRHELRKELKLLKLSNMKMKKQLRLSLRVRFLNRVRLEGEIEELNSLVYSIKKTLQGNIDKDPHLVEKMNFSNPKSTQFIETTKSNPDFQCEVDKSVISSVYKLPVKSKLDSEYKFLCDRCEFRCKKKTPFDIHMRRHDGLRPFACEHCSKTFVAKYELKLHAVKHANGQTYSCEQCTYTTYSPDMLVSHKEKHTEVKSYECEICSLKINDRCKIVAHRKTHHPENVTYCSACKAADEANGAGNKIESDDNNRNSELNHTCGSYFNCHICASLFKNQESLKKHMKVHSGIREYQCDLCHYAAAAKHTLIVHMRRHSGEKPYECSVCSFRCTTKGYLKIHLNNHRGIKPYSCHLCNYRSSESCKLSVHKRSKHGIGNNVSKDDCDNVRDKLLICKHCALTFSTITGLMQHEAKHTGVKSFTCSSCAPIRTFPSSSQLLRHRTSFHGREFRCPSCAYNATSQRDLQRHLRTHAREVARTCSVCQYRCVKNSIFIKHMKNSHPDHPFDSTVFLQEMDRIDSDQSVVDPAKKYGDYLAREGGAVGNDKSFHIDGPVTSVASLSSTKNYAAHISGRPMESETFAANKHSNSEKPIILENVTFKPSNLMFATKEPLNIITPSNIVGSPAQSSSNLTTVITEGTNVSVQLASSTTHFAQNQSNLTTLEERLRYSTFTEERMSSSVTQITQGPTNLTEFLTKRPLSSVTEQQSALKTPNRPSDLVTQYPQTSSSFTTFMTEKSSYLKTHVSEGSSNLRTHMTQRPSNLTYIVERPTNLAFVRQPFLSEHIADKSVNSPTLVNIESAPKTSHRNIMEKPSHLPTQVVERTPFLPIQILDRPQQLTEQPLINNSFQNFQRSNGLPQFYLANPTILNIPNAQSIIPKLRGSTSHDDGSNVAGPQQVAAPNQQDLPGYAPTIVPTFNFYWTQ